MVSDEQLMSVVEAFIAHNGNKAAAARSLNMAVNTFKDQYKLAVRRNLTADFFGGPVPEGYVSGNTTVHYTDPVTKKQEWLRLWPVSGNAKYQEAIEEWANRVITPLPLVPPRLYPVYSLEKLSSYVLPDIHMGQYSWGKETGGSYDLDIARQVVLDTQGKVQARMPATAEALIVYLGDNLHADGPEATTPKHGNHLDVDSRYDKVQWIASELVIETVDRALQKHSHVTVKVLPGNHDPRGYQTLTAALWFRYRDNPRVTVDRAPGVFYFHQWGSTMLAFHHGHTVKPEHMPGVMAAYEPDMWGKTKFRYGFQGHLHKHMKFIDEKGGAIVEVMQAITAKDAWNREQGHTSGRSMTAFIYDKEKGETDRVSEPIQ